MEELTSSCDCWDTICTVTTDASQYCVRVDVSDGDSTKKTKCSDYPLCQNTSGFNSLVDTCLCGHNEDSHDGLFEFNICNTDKYCSGDPQLEDLIGDITYYSSGDLRCVSYPDVALDLVFTGFSLLDAQNSASSIESIVLNHLDVPSYTRVIFSSASFSARRRVDNVYASYRVSPMETEDAAANLLAEIQAILAEFLAASDAELSSNFQKDISVDGVTVGEEVLYDNPSAPATSESGGVSITIILVIGVGLLAALLMCFIVCKMRENKRLKQEMLKEEGTIGYNHDYSDSESHGGEYVEELPMEHHVTPYSPSSSGHNYEGVATGIRESSDIDDMLDDRHMDEEEGEENPNRRTARHASKSSKSMRLVTAGGYGESPSGEIEMDILSRSNSQGSGEVTPMLKPAKVFHLPNTPPQVLSPVEVETMDNIVLPMHTDQGPEPLTRDRSEGTSIYRRPSTSRNEKTTRESSVDNSMSVLRLQTAAEGNDLKSDYKNDRVDPSLITVPRSSLPTYESEGVTPTPNDGMGTNI